MRFLNCSTLLVVALASSSAYAACNGESLDALLQQSRALCNQFQSADKSKNSSARPSEAQAQEIIACLDPFAASSQSNKTQSLADVEISGLWGFIMNDYRSGLDKKDAADLSWNAIKAAVELDPSNENAWKTLASGITQMRHSSWLDKMAISANGIDLDKEKEQCLDGIKALGNISPDTAKARDDLARS